MKNASFAASAFVFVLFVGLCCSSINRFSEKGGKTSNASANSKKSTTDGAVDTAVGKEKIGVPECDEVVEMLKDYASDPDDNFVVKAGKAMFVNKIREAITTSLEENKNDKAELAKKCREFGKELEKYKVEQGSEAK